MDDQSTGRRKSNANRAGKSRGSSGFSKLSKRQKIDRVIENSSSDLGPEDFSRFWLKADEDQKVFDEFSENTLSNFIMPFGVAPRLLINGREIDVPMVIEESSVVAAASKSLKFWRSRGGFTAQVQDVEKVGQVYFQWEGDQSALNDFFVINRSKLIEAVKPLMINMEKRGGGLRGLELKKSAEELSDIYELKATFNTCDAMGANFINTVLEGLGKELASRIESWPTFKGKQREAQIVMAILSNYNPNCVVKARVQCLIDELGDHSGMGPQEFAEKFCRAVSIARASTDRAVTHNKGIYNGIDSVILATGNDFRAIEACGHAYAARDGQYRSLSRAWVEDDQFIFELEVPLPLGTVGGLTSLHPLSKAAFEILRQPNAEQLMEIVASIGLASNFAAVRSLVTTGIQHGHMKMHLLNICHQFAADDAEIEALKDQFKDRVVSVSAVREELNRLRKLQ